LVTLLTPPSITAADIGKIADDLAEAARIAKVDILGGHTEITDAVTRPITSAAVIARCPKGRELVGMQSGNSIVMTKWAGIEGTAIIAENFPELCKDLTEEQKRAALSFNQYFSVTQEGLFASIHGATAMHDVTEGGVLGACWEMAHLAGCGIVVDTEKIPVREETRTICAAGRLDPLRLISSGSMLIACEDGEDMVNALRGIGCTATVIGYATPEGLYTSEGAVIDPPEADELYRLYP